jgi:ABC-type amino acid transport system permease subunit
VLNAIQLFANETASLGEARVEEVLGELLEDLAFGIKYKYASFVRRCFVLLPMAFRIVIPPLTSESMNIIKNSSVAFAVSIAELTMFALQAGEETSRNIEMYLAVTGLYFISAFTINRLMLVVENRVRVPGMIGSK